MSGMTDYEYVVLTVSDSCYHGSAVDNSGPVLEELLKKNFGAAKILRGVVPDEQKRIQEVLLIFSDEQRANVIFTTGGTGFAKRDVTPEATRSVIQKEAPQLAGLMIARQMANVDGDVKNKMVALSRAVCGIRDQTLIVNFPGSVKAVTECFEAIKDVIPHIIHLLVNDLPHVKSTHEFVQGQSQSHSHRHSHGHRHGHNHGHGHHHEHKHGHNHHHQQHACPTRTKDGPDDRSSTFPMIEVDWAQNIIFENTPRFADSQKFVSTVNIPPFRASIKDGYALRASSGKGVKKVIGYISAGDPINEVVFKDDECFKINTGAAIPLCADCVVQVEDTKLVSEEEGVEKEVEILTDPRYNLDIREVGCDMIEGTHLFSHRRPLTTTEHAILASVGQVPPKAWQPKIAIFSTGDELQQPGTEPGDGKIFDSNTTMLVGLLRDFGFTDVYTRIIKDTKEDLVAAVEEAHNNGCHAVVSSGGVSMGDKDYVKPVLSEKGYTIKFGRVNMKPGKPMTFAFNPERKAQYYGLPGNPVSAFVTFHLFVLPGLRQMSADDDLGQNGSAKIRLPMVTAELLNDRYDLDSRPEYARATIVSKDGKLYAEITGNQMSSRLMSVKDADVILHLPAGSADKPSIFKGHVLKASILKHDFISRYE